MEAPPPEEVEQEPDTQLGAMWKVGKDYLKCVRQYTIHLPPPHVPSTAQQRIGLVGPHGWQGVAATAAAATTERKKSSSIARPGSALPLPSLRASTPVGQ